MWSPGGGSNLKRFVKFMESKKIQVPEELHLGVECRERKGKQDIKKQHISQHLALIAE